MTSRPSMLLFSSCALAWLAVVACATDNGQTVYGNQYAPNEKVDAANDGAPVNGDGPDAALDARGDVEASAEAGAPCGRAAILTGNDSLLSGAIQKDGTDWVGTAIAGGASKNLPALVAFGTGFFGVVHGAGDALQTVIANDAFGAIAAEGQAGLKAGPSVALVGTTAHIVYPAGASYAFFHGTFDGAAYAPAGLDEAVGAPQAIGNSGGAIAAAGTDLAFVQAGTNNGLYFNTYSGGAWGTAAGIAGAGAYALAAPAMVSTPGNTYDLVIVFLEKTTHHVQWAARNATSKAFGTPADVDATAISIDDLAIGRTGAFTVLMTFRGTDGKGYESYGTENGTAFSWTTPIAIVPGGIVVDSAPAISKGVCGDDAILAYASSGQVHATHLRGAAWSPPEFVNGVTGSRVAIATRPAP